VEKIFADGVLLKGPGGSRRVDFKPASARPHPLLAGATSPPGKAPLKPTPNLPSALEGVAKAIGQVLAQDSSAATGRRKNPAKSGP